MTFDWDEFSRLSDEEKVEYMRRKRDADLTDDPRPDPGLPSSTDALIQAVIDTVTASRRADAVPITTPGKFAGPVT